MMWGNRARRRAEEFAARVERPPAYDGSRAGAGPDTGSDTDPGHGRDAELLELVAALRAVPDPQPRPEFVADLRTRLLAEAESALVPDDLARLRLPARRTRRERRFVAVVAGVVIAGTTASVAVASQSALPGESLYPIKRALESAHSGLVRGDAARGEVDLASATDRLVEATALARSEDATDRARVAGTLQSFHEQATSGADRLLTDYDETGHESSIVTLRDFVADSLSRLTELEPLVPDDARDELVSAAGLLARLDAEADRRCADCGGAALAEIPASLLAAAPLALPTELAPDPTRSPSERSQWRPRQRATMTVLPGRPEAPPEVGDALPPGSVRDPDPPATTGPRNPLQPLTDGLADALGGGKPPASKPTKSTRPGREPTRDPVTGALTDTLTGVGGVVDGVVGGVGGLLQGVLDPLTGQPVRPQGR